MADGTIPITGYNADGAPIINPESNYTEVGFAMEDDPQGRWKAGVSNMYVNRDPRFYATINFNGAVFKTTRSNCGIRVRMVWQVLVETTVRRVICCASTPTRM